VFFDGCSRSRVTDYESNFSLFGPGTFSLSATRSSGSAAMKEQGLKVFSNANCMLITPPSSAKRDIPVMTDCFAEAKGMGVSVGYMGRTSVLLETVKTLFDRAIGRLPLRLEARCALSVWGLDTGPFSIS
jgi:hypothetical protein